MKDFKVFVEHAELVNEWKKQLDELAEKAGKKRNAPKQKKKDARIAPAVVTPDVAGLRIKDSKGEEYIVKDVDAQNVELEDPFGRPVDTTIAGMSKFKLD